MTTTGLGAWLRSIRESRGIYQKDLAQRVGISNALLSYYESGQRTIPPHHAVILAESLGVLPEDVAARLTQSEGEE